MKGIETIPGEIHWVTPFYGLVGVSRLKGIETQQCFLELLAQMSLVGVSRLKGIETNFSLLPTDVERSGFGRSFPLEGN